jgi:hypothetical protein
LLGPRLAIIVASHESATGERQALPGAPNYWSVIEMQLLALIGAVLLALVTAVGTASVVLTLLLRFMSKIR